MTVRCTILFIALMGLIGTAVPTMAQAQYPDWSGQWTDLDVRDRKSTRLNSSH